MLASAQPRRWLTERAARSYTAAGQEIIVDCGEGTRLLGYYNRAVEPAVAEGKGRLVVIIHGWEGSSESLYNLTVGPALNRHGFDTLRLNLRDHGDSHHLNEEIFHSCRLPEVLGAFQWINRSFPDRRVSVVGFSLGGNFALRVANRARAQGIVLDRVVAICPVLDPVDTMQALDQGSALYEQYFIRKWRRSLTKKKAAFPHIYTFDELSGFTNLKAMTDFFVTGYTEFEDLHTYLNGYAITHGRLDDIEVPTTMLLAEDDPVIPIAGLDKMSLPEAVQLFRSPRGGHCGFLQGWQMRSWVDEFVLQQLR